jgi:hypothetical protein
VEENLQDSLMSADTRRTRIFEERRQMKLASFIEQSLAMAP